MPCRDLRTLTNSTKRTNAKRMNRRQEACKQASGDAISQKRKARRDAYCNLHPGHAAPIGEWRGATMDSCVVPEGFPGANAVSGSACVVALARVRRGWQADPFLPQAL